MSVAARRGPIRSASSRIPPAGFSLLEIILALAILAGAIAVLSEVSRLGLQNARFAQDMARAQSLCEGKLAEITAGLLPAESAEDVPFEDELDPSLSEWLYSIEVNPAVEEGLLEVRVTVTKDAPSEMRPVRVSLVRWMIDPSVDFSLETTEEGSESLF